MSIRTKAIIYIQPDAGARVAGVPLPVQFNPTELSDSLSVEYNSQNTAREASKHFIQSRRDDFTVKLYYDASEARNPLLRNVMKQVKPLVLLTAPTVLLPAFKIPPICTFIWGTFVYRGQVIRIQENYSYFTKEGFPMRADVTVTFSSSKGEKEALECVANKNSRVLHTVRGNDRLDLIAFDVYGDATKWPLIAEANNIKDPVSFPAPADLGRQIAIPEI